LRLLQCGLVKYLLSINPESTNTAEHICGCYPLHLILGSTYSNEHRPDEFEDLMLFMLLHDQGAASRPQSNGGLALHSACRECPLSIVELVFNSYPQATLAPRSKREAPSSTTMLDPRIKREVIALDPLLPIMNCIVYFLECRP
jgi:hypothetical protein